MKILTLLRMILDSENSTLADGGSILGDSIRAEIREELMRDKGKNYPTCPTCFDGAVVSDICDDCGERHCLDCDGHDDLVGEASP